MTLTNLIVILSIGFIIGWLAGMLTAYRGVCDRLDNANIAMKTLLDVKVEASKERVQFDPSAN